MTKKILFIVNVDWFFVSHRLPLALEALELGYEVFLACEVTDKQEYLEKLGICVHPLKISRSKTGLVSELQALISIYKVLKEVNPDIAHFITIKPVLYGGDEVKREYALELNNEVNYDEYDAVVLAVAHNNFKNIVLDNDKQIVYDIKSVLNKSEGKL